MEYRTKGERVAAHLRQRIISGVYPRGSRLKQAEIAEQLHLSITPLREALRLLEAEGHVSGDSCRGAGVVPVDAGASAEIRMDDIAAMPQTLHFVRIPWAHDAFDLINAVQGRGHRAAREHEEILHAITMGDASAAMPAMREPIESGWVVLKSATADPA